MLQLIYRGHSTAIVLAALLLIEVGSVALYSFVSAAGMRPTEGLLSFVLVSGLGLTLAGSFALERAKIALCKKEEDRGVFEPATIALVSLMVVLVAVGTMADRADVVQDARSVGWICLGIFCLITGFYAAASLGLVRTKDSVRMSPRLARYALVMSFVVHPLYYHSGASLRTLLWFYAIQMLFAVLVTWDFKIKYAKKRRTLKQAAATS